MADLRRHEEEGGAVESGKQEGRRTFVRQLAAAVGGIAALAWPGAAYSRPRPQVNVIVPIPDVPWRQRIFCQFDPGEHEDLLCALRQCAGETDCDIVFGEEGSPDLFAIGGFVHILDRRPVGDEVWREYVTMYRDFDDVTPCFIIDRRTDLPLPKWRYTYRFDMRDFDSITTIAEAIRQMKKEMNRRLPALFARPQGAR